MSRIVSIALMDVSTFVDMPAQAVTQHERHGRQCLGIDKSCGDFSRCRDKDHLFIEEGLKIVFAARNGAAHDGKVDPSFAQPFGKCRTEILGDLQLDPRLLGAQFLVQRRRQNRA
jgi:hypothetical protein